MKNILKNYAANNPVFQRLNNFFAILKIGNSLTLDGATVFNCYYNILGYINQAPGQVPGVGCLKGRISQTLTSTVS